MESILSKVNLPSDLKNLSVEELKTLSDELREFIIESVSKTGGHLASSLGVVELTVALHKVFDTPYDKIVWDVGHQSYAHKILTGRKNRFHTLRQYEGISGFPKIAESEYDSFGTGHSSTSISAALGLIKARDLKGGSNNVIAVIGDGALTGGMALEALNHAGHLNSDLLVILNDNEMSISKNVGAISTYLSKIRMQPSFVKMRQDLQKLIKNIPKIGDKLFNKAREIESHLTYLMVPGVFFESLGFTYLGPFDGHNMEDLLAIMENVKNMKGPRIIHIITQKGKGYYPAEKDSTKFHGTIPFNIETGEYAKGEVKIPSYTSVFGNTITKLAEEDNKVVALTAAMTDGTGLVEFSEKFPHRTFDVGIAEQHMATFAAALASEGFKPFVCIYSSFLQRAYDQLIHDVCLQKLPVKFMIDRSGIVGEDGATHQGSFDISYLRLIPNLVIMAPKDENELQHMMKTTLDYNGPAAIRYPRGKGVGVKIDTEPENIQIGKAEILKQGKDMLFIAIGNMVYPCLLAAEELAGVGFDIGVINARFVKPLDKELLCDEIKKYKNVIVFEENAKAGGFGSAILELISENNIKNVNVKCVGLPDEFIEHAHPSILRMKYNLSPDKIKEIVKYSMEMV
ncbi:MAG: 1-deoxy-D-xylulose-5-phosphate synthase [Armatimonadota bacterium]